MQKICITTKVVRLVKGLRGFKKQAFGQVKEHQNPKLIQAAEFQAYTNHPKKQVLQIDYAMAFQCELQNENDESTVDPRKC